MRHPQGRRHPQQIAPRCSYRRLFIAIKQGRNPALVVGAVMLALLLILFAALARFFRVNKA